MKRKRLVFVFLAVLLVLVLVSGFYALRLQAAKCNIGNGTYCEGECCKVTVDGCIAGPCSIILKF